MSNRVPTENVGTAFKKLRDMPLNSGEDVREYSKTLASMASKFQQELESAEQELKLRIRSMNRDAVCMNWIQLQTAAKWISHYLGKAADHAEGMQKAAFKLQSTFEGRFSDEAIRERKEIKKEKERERKRKERERKK